MCVRLCLRFLCDFRPSPPLSLCVWLFWRAVAWRKRYRSISRTENWYRYWSWNLGKKKKSKRGVGIKTSDMNGRTTVELKNASIWKCFPNACLPSFAPKAFQRH